MRRTLLSSMMLLWINISIMAINMKVGETETLNIGNISHLQGCQWTISRPNDIVFTTTPQSYSTQVTIKAVNSFPASSPCIVQCKYYYLELDPITGRYIYSRTGYKDWTIFVGENGNSDEGGGGQDDDISSKLNIELLGTGEIEITEGSNATIEVGQGQAANWSSDDESIAIITKISTNKFNIYGVSGGMTFVRIQGYNGSSASCLVRVIKEGDEGSIIYDNSPEGILVKYIISSKENAECLVGGNFVDNNTLRAVDINTTGTLTIPWQVKGYTVIGVQQAAFIECKKLNKIVLPNSISYILPFAFYNCEQLKDINLPEGIKYINHDTFKFCKALQSVILPSTLVSINEYAFSCCYNLKSITIPKGVTGIDKDAFSNCKSLQNIYSYIEEPFFITQNVFECSEYDIYNNAKLYVPKGKKETYRYTPSWHLFKNIYELETNSVNSLEYYSEKIKDRIHTLEGKEQKGVKKGVNIIRYKNGKTQKIICR